MTIRFGTDGWRGIIADDFTVANVRLVTRAILRALADESGGGAAAEHDAGRAGHVGSRFIVGHDCRFGGEMFAAAAAEEIVAAGGTALVVVDYAPTPALSWATVAEGADGAIVITASHNPPRYNGLKFKAAHGGSAPPQVTRRFEAELERAGDAEGAGRVDADVGQGSDGSSDAALGASAVGGGAGTTVPVENLRERYLARLRELSTLEDGALESMSVVVDPLYGSGRGWLSELLWSYGARVEELHDAADPSFGGLLPEPIPPHTDDLVHAVRSHKADFGIALDGDADRLGAVTATGRFVNSHDIFALLLSHLVERRGLTGRVVKTVSTSDRIARMADSFGLALTETPIGFKYICEQMLAGDVLMGGEESGGIGFSFHVPERDGQLCALLLAEAVATSGRTLEQLLDDLDERFGPSSYDRVDVHLSHEAKERLLARLPGWRPQAVELAGPACVPVLEVIDIDGWKYRTPDGWVMIRPSGTEDLVRLYCEASDCTTVQTMLRWAREVVGA